MILTHLVMFNFLPGAGDADAPAPTPAAAATGGGWIDPKRFFTRHRVIIDGKRYEGTEEEIRNLLYSLLDEDAEEKPAPPPKKQRQKVRKAEPEPILVEYKPPAAVDPSALRSLIKEAQLYRDAWLTDLLRRIAAEVMEEEEDLEAILWAL